MNLLTRRLVANKELLLVDVGGHSDVEKSDHHFIVGLVAPTDSLIWIGIVQIVGGIIEPCDCLQFRSSFQRHGLREFVA